MGGTGTLTAAARAGRAAGMAAAVAGLARIRRLSPLLLCAAFLLGAVGSKADSEIERLRTARALADDLMSPFCPGRTLADCPSPDASAVKREIRASLRRGEPPEQVRARLEQRFGTQVVGVPRSAWGWTLPVVVLALLALAFAAGARRILRSPAAGGDVPLDPEVERELARELDGPDPPEARGAGG